MPFAHELHQELHQLGIAQVELLGLELPLGVQDASFVDLVACASVPGIFSELTTLNASAALCPSFPSHCRSSSEP